MSAPAVRRLAASNIAWSPVDDDAIAAILRAEGFSGVEIAPTKRWDSPIDATPREIADYRAAWAKRGLQIVALQALLFGRGDLQLFGSPVVRRALKEYLIALIEMAAGLGATALVFGSPKNRKRGEMSLDDANDIAAEFFREIGAVAASRGCVLCIEPNPPAYDCDFITTTKEAIAFCQRVGSRGVRVQGDVGAITTRGDDPYEAMHDASGLIGHFHASEPNLVELTDSAAHLKAAAALREVNYAGWVSIEMRAPQSGSPVDAVSRAAKKVSSIYLL